MSITMDARPRLEVDPAKFGGLGETQLCELFDVTPDELQWGIHLRDDDPVRLRGLAGLADFEKFASTVPTVNGPLTKLGPFQRLTYLPYFLGFAETTTLIPKGNGKTSAIAILLNYHLLTVDNPEISVGAALMRQADKLYAETTRIAHLPTLRAQLAGNAGPKDRVPWNAPRPGGTTVAVDLKPLKGWRQIRLGEHEGSGILKVLASDKLDKGTLEGSGCTLGVCEELHAHLNDAILASIQGGLHKRPGQLWSISTAGKHLDSVLGDIRAEYYRESVRREVPEFGALTVYRRGRDSIMFEWALKESDDLEDMAVVKRANPADFVTEEGLRALHSSPTMNPSRWKRNHCGIWTAEAEGWLDGREAWDANRSDERLQQGDEIYLGIDPGWFFDTFSIVAVKPTGDRKAFCTPIAILRPTKGKTVTHRQVKVALLDAMKKYRVLALGYDRNKGFTHIVEELSDEHGLNCVAVSMAGAVWVPLTAELRGAINDGSWTHPGEEHYTSHVLSGEVKATAAGERLHGRLSGAGHCDALMGTGVGWVTAFGLATVDEIYRGDRELLSTHQTTAEDDADDEAWITAQLAAEDREIARYHDDEEDLDDDD